MTLQYLLLGSWKLCYLTFNYCFPEVYKLVLGQILMSVSPEFVPFLGDWLAFKIAFFSKRGEGGQQWAMLENVGILTKTENRKRYENRQMEAIINVN